jgi:hypothetical protein
VLRIACSTTSGTVLNGIIVGGDLTTKGVVNDGLPTPEPSPAPPYEPICGAQDLFERWCKGYVAPTYTTSGAAATSTFHCVYGAAVALGGTTTAAASQRLPLKWRGLTRPLQPCWRRRLLPRSERRQLRLLRPPAIHTTSTSVDSRSCKRSQYLWAGIALQAIAPTGTGQKAPMPSGVPQPAPVE